MASRFPLFSDENIPGAIIKGLIRRGWDVQRAVDVFPQGTDDTTLFEYAEKAGRVFVSSDEPARVIGVRYLQEGRPFRGMICWIQEHQRRMTVGDFLQCFEAFAEEEKPFAYGIRHITPK